MIEHNMTYAFDKKKRLSDFPLVERREQRNAVTLTAMFELARRGANFIRDDNSYSRFNSIDNESSMLISSHKTLGMKK